MDANGTRYHLLLGKADWSACAELLNDGASPPTPALFWDDSTDELTLLPRVDRIPTTPGEVRLKPEDRRGAARDRYGNWYWIAPSGNELLVFSEGSEATTHFWASDDVPRCSPAHPAGPFAPVAPPAGPPKPRMPLAGLVVTAHHYLVVGTLAPAGLLIFDLHRGGPPRHLLWPAGHDFAPFDMAAQAGGGLWILDRPAGRTAPARLWEMDPRFRVRSHPASPLGGPVAPVADFAPLDPAPGPGAGCVLETAISETAAIELEAADPIAVETLGDGSVLVLESVGADGFPGVRRYACRTRTGERSSLGVLAPVLESQPGGLRLVAHDFAVVCSRAGGTPDRLYVVTDEGNQAFAFEVRVREGTPVLVPLREYLPLRRFGGKALVEAGGDVYYDFRDTWVPLTAQCRPRFETEATVVTPLGLEPGQRPAFDGKEPDCVWHRLMIDARIPPESGVEVWSRAANTPALLAGEPWRPEPTPYRRRTGSELPFVGETQPGGGTWELLFQRARGRFLQLKLRLTGNGRVTPRIRALRAYYPRFSYLGRYLPAVYREDPDSASFLDRFLANVEGVATGIEDRVAAAQILLDPRTAPATVLDWLAGWLAVALDPTWDEGRRRLFLRRAAEVLRARGTVRGLQMALRLALDECPDDSIFTHPFGKGRAHPVRIVESFRTRAALPVAAGDPTREEELLSLPTAAPGASGGRWQPGQGVEALHERYRAARKAANLPVTEATAFRLTPDDSGAMWRRFARTVLGFEPQSPGADAADWVAFLARRYGAIASLNRVWGAAYQSFSDVPLPRDELPTGGPALNDWYTFEAVVLAAKRVAHRFTVLVPVRGRRLTPQTEQAAGLARRVLDLEKPAHTAYEIRFYYAYFRVGEARLGFDTVLDHGSRSPDLLPPMVLGRGALSEAALAPRHPQDVADRPVVGRDRLTRSHTGVRL